MRERRGEKNRKRESRSGHEDLREGSWRVRERNDLSLSVGHTPFSTPRFVSSEADDHRLQVWGGCTAARGALPWRRCSCVSAHPLLSASLVDGCSAIGVCRKLSVSVGNKEPYAWGNKSSFSVETVISVMPANLLHTC